ncbi:hypothetical protein RF11_03474 [Thelohanellus kitauei]|uniref:Uncharacterized protein n=1 Tax=Thelohanellus kitauei TaxID=669202 RepID=A0A0C2ME72_THEKT|nr:hypothetical protein RF11_03474 [Thelohanellus kitauei]
MSTDKKITLSPSLLQLKFMQKTVINAQPEPQKPSTIRDAWFVPVDLLKLKPRKEDADVEVIDSFYDLLDLTNDGWILRREPTYDPKVAEVQSLCNEVAKKRKAKSKHKKNKTIKK